MAKRKIDALVWSGDDGRLYLTITDHDEARGTYHSSDLRLTKGAFKALAASVYETDPPDLTVRFKFVKEEGKSEVQP